MTDKDPHDPPRRLELSPAQVAGSALAAISAAFFASWAGTAGTLIGAGVGSILATVGAATYTWWLRRTSDAVRRTAAQVRETGMGSTVVVAGLRTRRTPDDGASDDLPAAADAETAPENDEDRWAFLRGRPWGKVLLVSLAVMATAIAGITLVEAVTGKPISAITRGDSGQGTSVGHLVGNDGTSKPKKKTTPTPSPTPTPTPSRSSSPSPTPTTSTSPTPTPQQSESPTPSPSSSASPSATPQGAPASGAGSTPDAGPSPTP